MDYREREEERIRLKRAIVEWNASRLDLFEITEPDEYLEFFGVMRFFFQEENDKVSTKCVRVSSTANTKDVINILIEKFHPDMRMLTIPEYTLYEVHANGEERKVEENERPLYVQLNWTTDLREGRFLLKRMSDPTAMGFFENNQNNQNFQRKLSKREKKEQKKKEKQAKLKAKEEGTTGEKLYNDLSKSRFTRTISNPDVVMRRRRQQKLEQMKKFQNRPDSGGTLKIYAHTVFPEVPYKTLLVSVDDTSEEIITDFLEKFSKEKVNPADYCLVKVVIPPGEDPSEYSKKGGWGKEAIMDDDESPLSAVMKWPESRGELIFELKKKPDDYQPRKRRQQLQQQGNSDAKARNGGPGWYNDSSKVPQDRLPYFLELNNDGTDIIDYKPKRHRLQVNVTEVGSAREIPNNGQYLQLFSSDILPRHCVVANMEGVVTVTPTSPEAETYVNDQRIYETTMLQHGAVVRIARNHTFRFCDPQEDPDYRESNNRNREFFETSLDTNGRIETTAAQDVLPAKLEFREPSEDQFLSSIVTEVDGQNVHFRLAPAYTLYLAARFRLSKMYRPEMGPTERAQRLTAFLNKIADLVDRTAQQETFQTAGALAFWLSNASEILHFIQHDQDLGGISQDAQEILQECIKDTFMNLARCMNQELRPALMAFFDPTTAADVETEDDNVSMDSWHSGFSQRWLNPPGREQSSGKPRLSDVCHIFLSAMTLLRRVRLNAALTIQIFSQLFHYINVFIFNKFVNPQNSANCTRQWASRIYRRLTRLEKWAEKQGLEIAAEAHLAQIIQTFTLMMSPKKSMEELLAASAQCFKLNSRQLGQILQNCRPDKNDKPIPKAWIDKAVIQAASTNDPSFGPSHNLPLEEELELRLAFVIPEDGYSCDCTKGIPNGFQEFLDPLARAGMVRITPQPMASGTWTVHMYGQRTRSVDSSPKAIEKKNLPGTIEMPPEPKPTDDPPLETFTMTLNKNGARGMGLSIIAAKGVGQDKVGVYVKQVVAGGAAEKNGRLMAGDQLLEVDSHILVGVTQEMAAEYLMKTGQKVYLKVAKKGAIRHGLAELLVQTDTTQVNKLAERPKSESMERPVPAPRSNMPRPGMPGYVGLQNTDKARSSPNLADDSQSSMPANNRDHYNSMPRERTSSTSDMKSQEPSRSRGVKVLPSAVPISQRSRSTPNLDPEMDSRQMPNPQQSRSNVNLQGPPQNKGPPANYRSNNYGDPYRQDSRPPQHHDWSDGSDRGSVGLGKDAPDLENFEREPYQRRVPRPSDSYGPVPQQRGPPKQRGLPMDQRGLPADYRGPPQNHRAPPQDYRGLSQDYRGPLQEQRGPPPDRRGPTPDHRGPPPDHRGPPPDHRGPPPDHRGPPPDHRGPPPNHRGPPPNHRGPPPNHRGPPPNHRGPPPDHRGLPPDHRGPPPGQRGLAPEQRVSDSRGIPSVDSHSLPYDPRGQPPSRFRPPRSQHHAQSQQQGEHPPVYSPQDTNMQPKYSGGPPESSSYGSPYDAPPSQHPPVQSYNEPVLQAKQQPYAYESAPPPQHLSEEQQLPPAPHESFINEQNDLPPPPPEELPPPPPTDVTAYPGDFPPPPSVQQDPRTASLSHRSEAMEEYQHWHEQERTRLQHEHEQRLREKQLQEEQQVQPQVDRPQYASLPRQSRISKSSGESPHSTLQRQNSVPKAVPVPKPPERTPASRELTGPRNEGHEQQPAQDNVPSVPDSGMVFSGVQLQVPQSSSIWMGPPMETNIDDAPSSPSPWVRDLVDKKEQLEEERIKRLRALEIAELNEQPHLAPQQQERLRKLLMDQEFQRRLEESRLYGDDDDDDDTEVRPEAAMKILQNQQVEDEAKRIRDLNEKEYQRQVALQKQRQEMAMRERQQERLQRLQNELASQKARQQLEEDQLRYPPPSQQQPWQGQPNNFNRPMDNDLALRYQEEEMQRRHEQQRLEYMRREAEIEQESRRLEEQLSIRGPQTYPQSSSNNIVHTRVNAGFVPAPEKTYITDPPVPVEQAPTRPVSRPTAQPPPPPISRGPPIQVNKSDSLPRPKPDIKPKPKPPPVAIKKVALNNRNNNARSATLPQGYKPPTSQYSNNYADSQKVPNSYHQDPHINSNSSSQIASTNPNNSQNSNSYIVGQSPGVIGNQEVYRDPRDKILANKEPNDPNSPQQLLSFKDKMKKFSGVTPESKTRTSKWEREFLAKNPELAE